MPPAAIALGRFRADADDIAEGASRRAIFCAIVRGERVVDGRRAWWIGPRVHALFVSAGRRIIQFGVGGHPATIPSAKGEKHMPRNTIDRFGLIGTRRRCPQTLGSVFQMLVESSLIGRNERIPGRIPTTAPYRWVRSHPCRRSAARICLEKLSETSDRHLESFETKIAHGCRILGVIAAIEGSSRHGSRVTTRFVRLWTTIICQPLTAWLAIHGALVDFT